MKLYRFNIALCAVVLITAVSSGASAQTSAETWTQDDVQKLCDNRWKAKKPQQVPVCVKNHAGKVGKPKTKADQQEIDTGKRPKAPAKSN